MNNKALTELQAFLLGVISSHDFIGGFWGGRFLADFCCLMDLRQPEHSMVVFEYDVWHGRWGRWFVLVVTLAS